MNIDQFSNKIRSVRVWKVLLALLPTFYFRMSNQNLAKPEQNLSKIATDLVKDYTDNGTLHGISFIGDNKRHWFERLFWAIIFCTSIYFAGTLIHDSYIKWKSTPIMTSVDEHTTLISEIPFPAITICPIDKYDNDKFKLIDLFKKEQKRNEQE